MPHPGSAEQAALAVLRKLREAGHQAYFAGGCVRDRLLGVEPKDFDVATDAAPDRVVALFRRTLEVGKSFGVVMVQQGRHSIEVATFRADGRYVDGRRPESVRFADLKSDVLRRDFTVNGMMLDPETGQAIDLVGGRDDLRRRLVRAIGDPHERFREDHLRLVRAVRFASQLNFEIEEDTYRAVRELAGLLTTVSGERIRNELVRIFASGRAAMGVRLLAEVGLLAHILPEAGAGTAGFDRALGALHHLGAADLVRGLAVLLRDVPRVGKDDPLEVPCERLKLSRRERQGVIWLVRRREELAGILDRPPCGLKRLARHQDFPALLDLYTASARAGEGDPAEPHRIASRVAGWRREDLSPEPLFDGHDLAAMGVPPGQVYARVLLAVEDAQLNGEIRTKEEAMERARELLENVE